MSAVTAQEIVSLIEGIVESDACMGSISDKQVVTALELVSRIKAHGIAPPDCVTQADEETHRRVDEAVRNGRVVDKRVPVDFVLVPVEPTDKMADSAIQHLDDDPDQQYYFKVNTAKEVYKAMLASAPEVKP